MGTGREKHVRRTAFREEATVTEQQSAGGDYGYDLVHEEARSGSPHPVPQAPRTPPSPGSTEPAEDYGYDEAHGF